MKLGYFGVSKKIEKTCSVEHCDKKYHVKGFCTTHYARYNKYGNPTIIKQVQHHGLTLKERFLSYVVKKDGCWEWSGGKDMNGYGKIAIKGVPRLAHRVSWELHNGEIPEKMCICHICDNPECTNPKHLFLGSQLDNIDDMHSKNRARQGHVYGEKHHNAKATPEIVRYIRANGNPSQAFANSVGLARSTVHAILKRDTWANIV